MIEKLISAGRRKSLAKPRQTSKNVPSASLIWGYFRALIPMKNYTRSGTGWMEQDLKDLKSILK